MSNIANMNPQAFASEGSNATRRPCRACIIDPTRGRAVKRRLTDHKLIRPVAACFINYRLFNTAVSNDQLRCGGRPVALLSDCLIAALDKEIRDKPLPLTDTFFFVSENSVLCCGSAMWVLQKEFTNEIDMYRTHHTTKTCCWWCQRCLS